MPYARAVLHRAAVVVASLVSGGARLLSLARVVEADQAFILARPCSTLASAGFVIVSAEISRLMRPPMVEDTAVR